MENFIPFIEKAKTEGNNRFFSVLGTLLIVVGAFLAGQLPLAVAIVLILLQKGIPTENFEAALQAPETYGIDPRVVFAGYVMSFAAAALALAAGIRWFHNRQLSDLWEGPGPDWRRLGLDGVILLALLGGIDTLFWLSGAVPYSMQARPLDALVTLVLAVVFVPIQAGFEELLFRGYLLQLFCLGFKKFLPAAVLSSILFSLLHAANPEVAAYGWNWALPTYFIFGFLACVLVYLDGNLRTAILFHTVNNIYGFAIVSYPNSALPVPALFHMEEMNMAMTLVGMPLILLVFILMVKKGHGWDLKTLLQMVRK